MNVVLFIFDSTYILPDFMCCEKSYTWIIKTTSTVLKGTHPKCYVQITIPQVYVQTD